MKTNHERKIDLLAVQYEITVDKLYSIAAEGKLTVSVLTSHYRVYANKLFLPNNAEEALEILEEFENKGGVNDDDIYRVHADSLNISSALFKRVDAGELNPELIFEINAYEDGQFLIFKVCNENGERIRFRECVMILEDSEIQKLETILGLDNMVSKQTKECLSVPLSKQEIREEAFDKYLQDKKIDITEIKAMDMTNLIIEERDKPTGNYFTKRLWSITDKRIEDFYNTYRKNNGFETKAGRPKGK